MLIVVWEAQHAALLGDDTADILHALAFMAGNSEYTFKPFEVTVATREFALKRVIETGAKRECALGHIIAVVVVKFVTRRSERAVLTSTKVRHSNHGDRLLAPRSAI